MAQEVQRCREDIAGLTRDNTRLSDDLRHQVEQKHLIDDQFHKLRCDYEAIRSGAGAPHDLIRDLDAA